MLKKLSGLKVYIGMIAAGVTGIAYAQGWIDATMTQTLGAIILAWTGVAVRAAAKKGGK